MIRKEWLTQGHRNNNHKNMTFLSQNYDTFYIWESFSEITIHKTQWEREGQRQREVEREGERERWREGGDRETNRKRDRKRRRDRERSKSMFSDGRDKGNEIIQVWEQTRKAEAAFEEGSTREKNRASKSTVLLSAGSPPLWSQRPRRHTLRKPPSPSVPDPRLSGQPRNVDGHEISYIRDQICRRRR